MIDFNWKTAIFLKRYKKCGFIEIIELTKEKIRTLAEVTFIYFF